MVPVIRLLGLKRVSTSAFWLWEVKLKRAAESPVILISYLFSPSQVLSEELGCSPEEIASLELNICDVQPSCLGGGNNEFIFSGRLDNLASSYCALRALMDSCSSPGDLQDESSVRMVALFDNEEVWVLLKAHARNATYFLANNSTVFDRVRFNGIFIPHITNLQFMIHIQCRGSYLDSLESFKPRHREYTWTCCRSYPRVSWYFHLKRILPPVSALPSSHGRWGRIQHREPGRRQCFKPFGE